jgi:hypothetical protein
MRDLEKYWLLYLLLSIACLGCETEGPDDYKNHFIKYYGGNGNQEAKDFVVNSDGTVVMLGTSYEPNGDTRLYVVKSDPEGNEMWAIKLGSTKEYAQDIELIIDGPDVGKLIVLSNVKKNEADSTAIRLTVITQEGDSLKSILFDLLESQRAKSITPLTSGGYYVAGNTTDTDAAQNTSLTIPDVEDGIIIEFQSDWTNYDLEQLGSSSITSVIKIISEPNALIFASYSDELTGAETRYESNFVFRKIDFITNDETTIWVEDPTRVNEFLTDIVKHPTGKYLAVGTQQVDIGEDRIYVAIVNSSLSSVLNESIIGPARGEGVSATSAADGSFWVVGNEILNSGRNIWVGKVSSDLNDAPSYRFGGVNNDDTASAIKELENGDVLVLGTMTLINQKKMALIKIKANGSF